MARPRLPLTRSSRPLRLAHPPPPRRYEIEFLTVQSLGGFVPRNSELRVEVVRVGQGRELVDCRTPQPYFERKIAKKRIERALIWKRVEGEGRCAEWELADLANRLQVDALLLYGAEAGEGHDLGTAANHVPMEAETAEIEIEAATHGDPDFNTVVETQLKVSYNPNRCRVHPN